MQIEDSPQLALEGLASVLDETGGGDRSMESNSTVADVSLSAAAYLLSRVGSVLGNESVEPAISNVSRNFVTQIQGLEQDWPISLK